MEISNFKIADLRMSYANRSQSCQGSITTSGPAQHIMLCHLHGLFSAILLSSLCAETLPTFISTRQSLILFTISSMCHPYKFGSRRWKASPRPRPAPAASISSHFITFSITDRRYDLSLRRCLRLGHRQQRPQLTPTSLRFLQGRSSLSE